MTKKLTRSQLVEEQLVLIESVLEKPSPEHDANFRLAMLEESLKFCIKEIRELTDENDSVWDMIEEIRSAEIANHSQKF